MARGGEGGAAVQDALVVEHHERAGIEPRAQLEARLAQQRGEAPVGGIEARRIARPAMAERGDRAAVVMHGGRRPPLRDSWISGRSAYSSASLER